ncbi:MAG: type IV pilus assembly protein PilM [Phycisphaerae bacterium]|nr:type IV pilus assembly protein PilM [Phycisphaerae bacterium]
MASISDAVWAIDLGNSSLKAMKLALVGDTPQVVAFDTIQHAKVLSGKGVSELERQELIAMSMRQFVQRNEVGYDDVIVSVPSQNSFARFVNLPPVDPKKIPEIVGFEAAQQIPFDMSEVQWDWQLMTDEDATEKRVGLFAIKNEIVNAELEHFEHEDLSVTHVQMSPMALYNYILYDRPDLLKSDNRPVVVLNIGAQSTDLVVCTPSGVWQRCIMLGGNAFTKAIADAFKIPFEKAEKLKRTAPVSKYARQIFQAMRPVFTDLASEVQKSLGFYSSANPNSQYARIIAMGGGTQLRGLLKYLQQSLQIPVERPDMFKRLSLMQGVSAAKFHDSVAGFGVVYGLALQVLGFGRIQSNLLPKSIARSQAWAMKIRMFMVAACFLLLVSLMGLGRVVVNNMAYASKADVRQRITATISQADSAQDNLASEEGKGTQNIEEMKKIIALFKYRDTIPWVQQTILEAMPNARNNPAQKALYESFEVGDAEAVMQTPRRDRKQLFVTRMQVSYAEDLAIASLDMINLGQGPASTEADGTGMPQLNDPRSLYGRSSMMMMPTDPGAVAEPGFVVVIEGYSPYQDIGQLLDPSGVNDRPDQWGFVTRLTHLSGNAAPDDPNDPNLPLVLYKKETDVHFVLTKGPVSSSDQTMPYGIGVPEKEDADLMPTGTDQSATLVDPLTKEVISSFPMKDDMGKEIRERLSGKPRMVINDNWFVLKFKLKWNDAPEVEGAADPANSLMGGYPPM